MINRLAAAEKVALLETVNRLAARLTTCRDAQRRETRISIGSARGLKNIAESNRHQDPCMWCLIR